MNNWSIRRQIVALSLLPIVVVSTFLIGYFTLAQLNSIATSQLHQCNLITRQLAFISQQAVSTGNPESLKPVLNKMLLNIDIREIKIVDKNQRELISVSNQTSNTGKKSIWEKLAFEERSIFRENISSNSSGVGFIDKNGSNKNNDYIGHVELTLTSTSSNVEKLQTLLKGILLSLFILIISMLLALRLSKKISRPILDLTNTVKQISAGNYSVRAEQNAIGDLGTLEDCVNIMAEELQSSRVDLEAKASDSTKELNETMEELEIRNAELDIARSHAVHANNAKTKFLSNMSHELRTPLGGILGFSELLEKTELKDQQRDYSEIIKKSANNLLHILDGILDLSKIESGKLDIIFSKFYLIDVIEEVVDLLTPGAYEKNIELLQHIDEATPRCINTDPVRIRQILINLIGNAIKFTEKGSVFLSISSKQDSESVTQLTFSVSDTGIGMNTQQQERLFDAFTQADTSIERRFGGTGLGLVISQKLAQHLNGNISVESHYDKGSVFSLTIPVKNEVDESVQDNLLLNKKIGIIDPYLKFSDSIQAMFKFWKCDIETHSRIPDNASSYDLIVVSICRKDLYKDKIKSLIQDNPAATPLLSIVSTRSHKELKKIRNYGFNEAVFRSSKQNFIHEKALNLINGESTPLSLSHVPDKNAFDWSGLNILVVDDNDINLKLAEIILSKNGAHVVTVASGQQSINLTNEKYFDLILMDIQMPELDGYQSAKIIRKNKDNNDTTIIALTANALAIKESHLIEQCGINDVLIKPINETSIQEMINKWLLKNDSSQAAMQPRLETDFFSKPEALKLAAGNAQLANELTAMLVNELPEYLTTLNNALSIDDISELKHTTHKLHGASRCCGTPALRYAAEQLENDINNEIVEQLEASSHLLINEIKKLIAADKAELMI